MGVLVVVLVLTNLLTLAGLAMFRQRANSPTPVPDAPSEVFHAPRPAGVSGRTRQLISIEILNPIEVVGARARVAGLAGSLAPGLTRRIVYDQTLRILRRQLGERHVVADVRLHTLRPLPPSSETGTETAVGTAPGVSSPEAAEAAPEGAPTRIRFDNPLDGVEDVRPINLSAEPWDQPPV